MLSITLRQLEYAVAVARDESVTLAAERLHVSQPALSVALQQIEAQMGQPLFLRRPGGPMRATPFGRAFLAEAEAILASLTRLTTGGPDRAPVRIAVFADLAPLLVAPLLARVAGARPDLEVTPVILGFEALSDEVASGRADLGLTYDLGLDAGFDRQVLAHIPPHAVLALDHPLAGHASVPLADLAAEPLILADQGLSVGHMRALFARAGLAPHIAHKVATIELLRSYAANGLGVGLSYTRPAPDQSYDGRPIAIRPVTGAGEGEAVGLVAHAGAPRTGAAGAVAALIAGQPLFQ